jgi:hypothetical protein
MTTLNLTLLRQVLDQTEGISPEDRESMFAQAQSIGVISDETAHAVSAQMEAMGVDLDATVSAENAIVSEAQQERSRVEEAGRKEADAFTAAAAVEVARFDGALRTLEAHTDAAALQEQDAQDASDIAGIRANLLQ